MPAQFYPSQSLSPAKKTTSSKFSSFISIFNSINEKKNEENLHITQKQVKTADQMPKYSTYLH